MWIWLAKALYWARLPVTLASSWLGLGGFVVLLIGYIFGRRSRSWW